VSEPSGVAIVGLACRFPGAEDADAFWRNLTAGVESVRFFEDQELLAAGVSPADVADPDYVKASPVLEHAEAFDAAFFGYSPREARLMDPQQRIFLEVAWAALEDAGLAPDAHEGVTGCFAGTGGVVTSWLVAHQESHPELVGATGSLAHLGNDKDFLATRASYRMDLRGPSVNVQTACSTSIVALHLACRSVLDGECDLALAGASTVRFPQIAGYRMEKGDILSPDGHCRAFDAGAQGTIFGSGAGVVVLKPLADALADGDPIHAVVRATALNNDGREKVSYTASSVPGQVRAMVEAMTLADVPADTLGYVECHGTGTAVGDPLEVQALTRAFRASTKKRRFCAIGSVKTNVGHLEQAAGMASLIKTALALRHGVVPPSLNFESPNPRIDFRRSPFFVNTELRDWPLPGPRRAGLNSLGLGGTNAFAVLEEPPPRAAPEVPDRPAALGLHLAAVDAPTDEALAALAGAYAQRFETGDPGEACWTSVVGRSRARRRLTVAAADRDELVAGLTAAATGRDHPGVHRARATARGDRPLAFLFTGQGAQRPQMGRELYARSEAFRAALDEVTEALRPILRRPLPDVLFAPADSPEAALLDRTEWTQPALFALQVGLVAQWSAWGVRPDFVAGHSVGAFAAAVAAGVVGRADAARLIGRRGLAMGGLPSGGAMAAVFGPVDDVERAIRGRRVEIGVRNGPDAVVVSGDEDAVIEVCGVLEQAGLPSRRLEVSDAFHSFRMDPALEELRSAAAEIAFRQPTIPWISETTGAPVDEAVGADYWVRHTRAAVRFDAVLERLGAARCGAVLEIGPSSTLLGLARRGLPDLDAALVPSLDPRRGDARALVGAAQVLHGEGRDLDWAAFFDGPRRRARLPTYPFARTVRALGPSRSRRAAGEDTGHPLLGRRLRSSLDDVQFEAHYTLEDLPSLRDHRMYGMAVLPTTVALEVARAAAAAHFGSPTVAVEDLVHGEAMVLPEDGARVVHAVLTPEGPERASFQLLSTADHGPEDWRLHARMSLALERSRREAADWDEGIDLRCPTPVAVDPFYRALQGHGLEYGPAFRRIRSLRAGADELVVEVDGDVGAIGPLHPSVLDACLHAYSALAEGAPPDSAWAPPPPAWLPISVRRFVVHAAHRGPVKARLRRLAAPAGSDGTLTVDVRVHSPDGAPVAEILGLNLRRLSQEVLRPKALDDVRDWLVRVVWRDVGAVPPAHAPRPSFDPGRWLVLGDPQGTAGAIAAGLVSRGQVSEVAPLGPRTSVSREVLAAWAGAEGAPCRGVVHAAAVEGPPGDPDPGWGWSLVALIQDLSELREVTGTGLRAWVVTRGVWSTSLDDRPEAPQAAGLWGVGRAAALEVPGLWGGAVDLPSHQDPVDAAAAVDEDSAAVVDELFADDREDQVAIRDGIRRVARLERVPTTAPERDPPIVRRDRTYLVTGGLGFLGLQVIRRLVERGARFVAVTSRSGSTARVAGDLEALRAAGVTVRVFRADVVREDDVRTLFARIEADLPPLAGVLHCAGMLDDGVITRLTEDQYTRVTAPKIVAAMHLDRHTRDLDLDHFVLFSSILSLIGSAGQANYTAGNAVLDAIAGARRARGLPASAINWGPWADAGLATESGARGEAIWRARGTRYIPLEGGIEVFDRLLDRDLEHCGVTVTDWSVFLQQWDPPPRLYDAFVQEVGPKKRSSAGQALAELRGRLDEAPEAARRPLIIELVRLQLMATLEIREPLDLDRPISEFGLDSLMSVSLVNRLETLLGVPVPVVKLIAGPTIVELVDDLFPGLRELQAEGEAPPSAGPHPSPTPPPNAAPRSRWLVPLNPTAAPRLRLFCFPFAGGGSAVFRGWVEHLSPDIELVAVEPPGRLHRIRERPIRTMRAFLDGLVPAMEPLLDRPYACFGHCLGGLTMFETMRELRRRGAREPLAMFSSGSRPPDRVNRRGPFEERLARMLGRAPRFNLFLNPYEQPDEVFADVIRQFDIEVSEALLESAELRALMLPAVRAEFEMTARYRYKDERPFTFPITCFSGKDDLYVSREDSMRWGRFTHSDFRLLTREGAHFLMVEDRSFLVQTIQSALDEVRA